MKPRRENESDQEYIARLECSRDALKADNDRCRKAMYRMFDNLIPAAQKAGQILQLAAELTGTRDDPEVWDAIQRLELLGTCSWNDDEIHLADFPAFPKVRPEFSGDVDMMVRSALEKAKAAEDPWDRNGDLYAKVAALGPDADWQDIFREVCDALCDLDASRSMLRLDLRSAMYDFCFARIHQALRLADEKARPYRALHHADNEAIPF